MKLTIKKIIKDVEDYYGLLKGEIRSPSRSRTLIKARQLAIYLMRQYTQASYPEIAEELERDHQTIIHAFKNFNVNDNKFDLDYFISLYSKEQSLAQYNVSWEGVF